MGNKKLQDLIIAAKEFDRSKVDYKTTELNRQEFVNKFPIENLKDLTLEQYAAGTTSDSFCYWLEFKKNTFGIGGGNANKFGIFKGKDGNYYNSVGDSKIVLSKFEAEQVFREIKDFILSGLQSVKNKEFDKLINLKVPLWPMVINKILQIYYPDDFISIGRNTTIVDISNDLEIELENKSNSTVYLNYLIKKQFSSMNFFEDWNYVEISKFLWQYYTKNDSHGDNDFLSIIENFPNNNLNKFNQLLSDVILKFDIRKDDQRVSFNISDNGIVFLVGQRYCLKMYYPNNEFNFSIISNEIISERYKNFEGNSPQPYLNYLIDLELNETQKFHFFNAIENELKRTKKSGFRKNNNNEFENFIMDKISNELILEVFNRYKNILREGGLVDEIYKWELLEKYKGKPDLSSENFTNEFGSIDYANLVYQYSNTVIKSLANKKTQEFRNCLSNLFDETINLDDRIKSYINETKTLFDNIKEKVNEKHNQDERTVATLLAVKYPDKYTFYKDSFYGKFCEILRVKPKSTGLKLSHYFELLDFLIRNFITLDEELLNLVKSKLPSNCFEDDNHLLLAQDILYQVLDKSGLNDINELYPKTPIVPVIISNYFPKNLILYGPPGTGKTYNTFEYVKNEIFEDEALQKDDLNNRDDLFFVTFHQSFSYEQFVEGIGVDTNEDNQVIYSKKDGVFKNACLKAISSEYKDLKTFLEVFKDRDSRKKYFEIQEPVVLIIDEINRGNISKIFGELITLIEDDKRLGEENEIIVTLPYSGEQFGVPPNLYIVGTMNTADRSLVQLDTALRRRFDFEEMMPKYHETNELKNLKFSEKLEWNNKGMLDDKFDLSVFLHKLNEKITKELDREHQIGHSFLMKVQKIDELKRAWENKIMPLLQEYFYADYDTLSKIIGNNSEYLKKEKENNGSSPNWLLNMKVDNFESNFRKIYDFVTKPKSTNDSNNSSTNLVQ